MAYDPKLAARVRRVFAARSDVEEKAMFGGLAFMVGGHLCCGVMNERLMVRVGAARYEALLREPDAAPMDFTGRSLRGLLYVNPAGLIGPKLRTWMTRAIDFAESQPAKVAKRSRKPTRSRPR